MVRLGWFVWDGSSGVVRLGWFVWGGSSGVVRLGHRVSVFHVTMREWLTTAGIDFKLKTFNVQGKRIRLQIW